MYKKVADILEKHLTKEEFLKLNEQMDEDPSNDLFWILNERAAKMAPELFVSPNNNLFKTETEE